MIQPRLFYFIQVPGGRFGDRDIPLPSQYDEALKIIQAAKKPISCGIARQIMLMRQEKGGKYPVCA